MSRDRAWRRAQSARVKANHKRTYRERTGLDPEEIYGHVSDDRHPLDCGHSNCQMCHYDKNVIGHTPERQHVQREIAAYGF